jgi:type I restriction enzyme S subunit
MINLTKKQLQEFAAPGRSVISGPFGSNIGKRFFQDTGIPIIRGNNLTTDHKKFKDDGFAFLTQEKADELRSDAIMGDILFTAAGTIGQVGMIPKNAKYDRYVISNKQIRFRVDEEKADPEFIYYWLASPWIYKAILNRNTGSTVPLINLGIIKSLPISIPNKISDQKKIANIFSSIDKKIELNKKINTELEAMAKLIYDYWFVQFDFPDANGKPYKSSGGKMVYNEELRREIPEVWEVTELDEIATCIMGHSPKGDTYNNSGVGMPLLNGPADYKNGALFGRTYTTSPTRVCEKNDLVLCIRATIGNLVYSEDKYCLGRGVAAVRPKKVMDSELIYFLILQEIQRFKIQATGSIIKGITKDDLAKSKCFIPSKNIGLMFHNLINPMFDKLRKNKEETLSLIELRDWLLPMLMNGQVTIKDPAS